MIFRGSRPALVFPHTIPLNEQERIDVLLQEKLAQYNRLRNAEKMRTMGLKTNLSDLLYKKVMVAIEFSAEQEFYSQRVCYIVAAKARMNRISLPCGPGGGLFTWDGEELLFVEERQDLKRCLDKERRPIDEVPVDFLCDFLCSALFEHVTFVADVIQDLDSLKERGPRFSVEEGDGYEEEISKAFNPRVSRTEGGGWMLDFFVLCGDMYYKNQLGKCTVKISSQYDIECSNEILYKSKSENWLTY